MSRWLNYHVSPCLSWTISEKHSYIPSKANIFSHLLFNKFMSDNRERPKNFVSYLHVKVNYTNFDWDIISFRGAITLCSCVLVSIFKPNFNCLYRRKKKKTKNHTHWQCLAESIKTTGKYHHICTSATFAYSVLVLNNGLKHIKALGNS